MRNPLPTLLTFKPAIRRYVWGGRSLLPFAGEEAAQGDEPIAEIWTIYENNPVAAGRFTGVPLNELTEQYPLEILGQDGMARGRRFPLLIKLLDCAQWLSLQVHPNDEQAQELEGPGFLGKTEAWHILKATADAQLIAGIKPGTSAQTLTNTIGRREILELVKYHKVREADTVFMPAGTIHAIGPGLLIYEVQQTSDLTYRVYDWDRPQVNGRILHVEKSNAVADPSARGQIIQAGADSRSAAGLVESPFFHLEKLSGTQERDTQGKSFHALTVTRGQAVVSTHDSSCQLGQYQSVLVTAAGGAYRLEGDFGALCSSIPGPS